jgi:hypothetical protein
MHCQRRYRKGLPSGTPPASRGALVGATPLLVTGTHTFTFTQALHTPVLPPSQTFCGILFVIIQASKSTNKLACLLTASSSTTVPQPEASRQLPDSNNSTIYCRSSQIGSQATNSQSALPSPTPLSLKSLGMRIMCKNPDINPSPTFPTCTPLGKIAAEPLALHAASVRSRSRAGLRREWTERKG